MSRRGYGTFNRDRGASQRHSHRCARAVRNLACHIRCQADGIPPPVEYILLPLRDVMFNLKLFRVTANSGERLSRKARVKYARSMEANMRVRLDVKYNPGVSRSATACKIQH
ncbi:hypothetical protein DAEQUDRAFT_295905 [Daedalea quercina L-15889]|uniref:Uncharacterized protein n=1 Tax=Daedalea quercina L-15889 TaxID=1314783 RepID=A0A165U141_9APHY|nr:hypothetical protein DAEQUDRAFT_295905 [Daedalea quercina L-15889]